MKTIILPVLLSLFLISCKGEKGDPGQPGQDANILLYTGLVANDDFTVFVVGNPSTHFVTVSTGDGINYSELPYFIPAFGVNTFFLFKTNSVRIVNAQLAGATNYRIFVVAKNGVSASGYRKLLGN